MDDLQIGVLIFLAAVIGGYVLWLRWMGAAVRQIAARTKGGIRSKPEEEEKVKNVYIIHFGLIAAQVILCAVAVFTKPSALEWMIGIPLLFALNFGSRFRAKKIMMGLLGEGKV